MLVVAAAGAGSLAKVVTDRSLSHPHRARWRVTEVAPTKEVEIQARLVRREKRNDEVNDVAEQRAFGHERGLVGHRAERI